MNGQYTPGDVVLGNWALMRLIGEGSNGRVFEAERKGIGKVSNAAVKIITIPKNEGEIKSARAEGVGSGHIPTYFRDVV